MLSRVREFFSLDLASGSVSLLADPLRLLGVVVSVCGCGGRPTVASDGHRFPRRRKWVRLVGVGHLHWSAGLRRGGSRSNALVITSVQGRIVLAGARVAPTTLACTGSATAAGYWSSYAPRSASPKASINAMAALTFPLRELHRAGRRGLGGGPHLVGPVQGARSVRPHRRRSELVAPCCAARATLPTAAWPECAVPGA